MNIHKNAQLTLARRLESVREIVDKGLTPCTAAAVHGVTEPTARKWLGRYLSGLCDRSSRPKLRRGSRRALGVSKSAVGRVLKRAGLSRVSDLEPCEPIVRYEHEHPGDLIHIDTKKLGRFERMGKRIPGASC